MIGRTFSMVLFCLLVLGASPAAEGAEKSLLVLFKSSEGDSSIQNIFAHHLQAHAQSKGFQVRYHDIDASLPAEEVMGPVHAIVTVYNGPIMKSARAYVEWIAVQLLHKKKVLVIGNFGAFSPDGKEWFDGSVVNRFYYLMGLDFAGHWTDDPNLIQTAFKDPEMVERELPLTPDLRRHYFLIRSTRPENRVFLSLSRKDLDESESAVIVKTPTGGLALENYVFAQQHGQTKKLLHLDRFFDECVTGAMPDGAVPGKRILALYKSEEDPAPEKTFISRFLLRDLLDLGYWPEFYCVDKGAPRDQDMTPYSAVLTWFRTPHMYEAERYCDWLLKQIREGRKVIIFGNFGAFGGVYEEAGTEVRWFLNSTALNHFLYPFGVEFRGNWTGDPTILQCVHKSPEMVEKEVPLEQEDFRHYYQWRSIYPENEAYLKVGRKDLPSAESAFVVRTPFGGLAFEGYIFKTDPKTWKTAFFLDTHRFLKSCLGYKGTRKIEPIALVTHEQVLDELRKEEASSQKPSPQKAAVSFEPNEIRRRILALYKLSETDDYPEGPIFKFVEPVLNHLGFFVDYHPVEQGLPDDKLMDQYHGVITWFGTEEMKSPEAYAAWLMRQMRGGRKVVILGNYGASIDKETRIPYRQAKNVFAAMGLKYWDSYLAGGKHQEVLFSDKKLMDFESKLRFSVETNLTYKVTSEDKDNMVILRLKDSSIRTIEPIVITRQGAVALGSYLLGENDPKNELGRRIREMMAEGRTAPLPELEHAYAWCLNPYLFFKAALGLTGIPAPDVTTLNGHRIFYSHLDGDGFKGISLIDRANYSGWWVMEEIFKKYPLPITASVITSDIEREPSLSFNRPWMLAREMYRLPNIEPASHTFTHPFMWRKPSFEIAPKGGAFTVVSSPIDYLSETEGSLRFMEKNLLPPEKKARVLLWSGQCNPDERALGILHHYGRVNMNPGDPIFDDRHNSRTGLCTYSRIYGGCRQVHTSGMNDYLYTSGWTRDFDGMKNLVSHFEHTEAPQRLSALNIYYHFYIGDRREGLQGLKAAYDYCLSRKIAPMFASQYIQTVLDYHKTRILKGDHGAWIVKDNGSLRTIRFDGETRYPDLVASQGIIGFGRVNSDLYVYLDDGPVHSIRLTERAPTEPFLARGSHNVDRLSISPGMISYRSGGYGDAEFVFANLPPGATYHLSSSSPTGTGKSAAETRVDEEGTITIRLPFRSYQARYDIVLRKH